MLDTRFERLNALAKLNQAGRYLEIGVNKGITFNKIEVPFKVAVDPRFLFDTAPYANAFTHFHDVTSDDFFTKVASQYESFDLIYLDGLHTFEQTLRDFCASLRFSHSKTIWLLDDTCPSSMAAAEPDVFRAKKLKRLLGEENDKSWMGDVYKLVFVLHDFFPQFNWMTFTGHGQTAIYSDMRMDFKPRWNSMKKIGDLNFDSFVEFKDTVFNVRNPTDILDAITKALAVQPA